MATHEMPQLTLRNGLDFSSPRQHVSNDDPHVNGYRNHTGPPPDDVANEVDLLLRIVLRPEADSTDEERPVNWATGIRVRSNKTGIVL